MSLLIYQNSTKLSDATRRLIEKAPNSLQIQVKPMSNSICGYAVKYVIVDEEVK